MCEQVVTVWRTPADHACTARPGVEPSCCAPGPGSMPASCSHSGQRLLALLAALPAARRVDQQKNMLRVMTLQIRARHEQSQTTVAPTSSHHASAQDRASSRLAFSTSFCSLLRSSASSVSISLYARVSFCSVTPGGRQYAGTGDGEVPQV